MLPAHLTAAVRNAATRQGAGAEASKQARFYIVLEILFESLNMYVICFLKEKKTIFFFKKLPLLWNGLKLSDIPINDQSTCIPGEKVNCVAACGVEKCGGGEGFQ